ncbi:NAD(P)-dependent oxidoreductase [Rickettsiella endosymbiont of Aleochara curtula]|uniref:NAD-dependent epimerase/dehydratase family protein n=1 Tax=Rickettsiella endosymbiont of Aleochara curtula TaxID=3077936 RepID=UPI00313CF985
MFNPLQADLDYIFLHTKHLWEELRNKHIFITGGTGFFGCWILESLVFINKKIELNVNITIITRYPNKFNKKCPHLAKEPFLRICKGDILDFKFSKESFHYLIHAAVDTSIVTKQNYYLPMLTNIANGTKRILEFARIKKIKKVLFISSGAVYRNQITNREKIDLNNFMSCYAGGKDIAESMCNLYVEKYQLDIKIARCFSFVGPYLPLDLHYAIGNFIRDKLNGNSIKVNGDGTSIRSYLYAADLTIWLWNILFRGKNLFPYDVGSDQAVTIKELAELIANSYQPKSSINILQPYVKNDNLPERYVPNTLRATKDFKLLPQINLSEAIKRTFAWHIFKRENA